MDGFFTSKYKQVKSINPLTTPATIVEGNDG